MFVNTMVVVEVLDPKVAGYKPIATRLAKRLMRTLNKDNFYLEIYIVGKKQMRKNVLAFPAATNFPRPDLKKRPLGEIYLNPTYIKEHEENFDYMLIHGFLHLLGYDHIKKSDRIAMEKKERTLLFQMTNS